MKNIKLAPCGHGMEHYGEYLVGSTDSQMGQL